MMQPGDKAICSAPEWFNAFGEKHVKISQGQRLTVLSHRYVHGTLFYYFEETPEDCCYLATGITPLKNLN